MEKLKRQVWIDRVFLILINWSFLVRHWRKVNSLYLLNTIYKFNIDGNHNKILWCLSNFFFFLGIKNISRLYTFHKRVIALPLAHYLKFWEECLTTACNLFTFECLIKSINSRATQHNSLGSPPFSWSFKSYLHKQP